MACEGTSSELGDRDLMIAKRLRSVGMLIGRHPKKWAACTAVVCLASILSGLATRKILGGSEPILSEMSMELQWTVSGGKTERTIRRYEAEQADKKMWLKKTTTTMFVPKDPSVIDIATPPALDEMHEILKQWTNLSTEVNGKTYTMFDVCERSILPDAPPPAPAMRFPCSSITPLNCFMESGEYTDPMWNSFVPFVAGAVPYDSRPSFRNLTSTEIRAELSKVRRSSDAGLPPGQAGGCFHWDDSATLFFDLFGGRPVWNNGTLESVGAFRFLLAMDAPERIKYRLMLSKPELANVADIDKAQAQLSGKWHKLATDYGRTTRLLEVANVEDFSAYTGARLEQDQKQVKGLSFILGGILMFLFCYFALVSYSYPQASRANIGFNGLGLVVIAQWTALGIYFLFGLHLNATMLMCMPLLALGLGVDDMFVLVRYFSNLGHDFINGHTPEQVIGEVLAQAGPGTTLTSCCNILTFGIGAFLPIPAMRDFCIGAVLVSFMNYMIMINLFMPVMVGEVHRVQSERPDPHPFTLLCHRRVIAKAKTSGRASIRATSSAEYSRSIEKSAIRFLKAYYAPFMMRPVVRAFSLVLTVGLIVTSLLMIQSSSIGYSPWELFERGSTAERGVQLLFQAFSLFPSSILFTDLDVASNQVDMVKVFADVLDDKYAVMSPIMNFVGGLTVSGSDSGSLLCPVPVPDNNFTTWCDMSYTHPQLAPLGVLPADRFDQAYNEWRYLPTPAEAMQRTAVGQVGFMYADLFNANLFSHSNASGVPKLTFSFFEYFQIFPYREGVSNEGLFIDAIRDTNAAIERSPIRDYVSSYGSITTFWEVFLELDSLLHILLGVGICIVFLCTFLIFSFDLPVAIITCVSCGMIVVEVYGIAAYFMNFNVFVAAITLLGLGMAVEFTAHFAASFSSMSGEANHVWRLGEAMGHTFPALLEGSISTITGVVPLAFSMDDFSVKYLFGIIALVVSIGLFNGLVVMPGLISILSPLIRLLESGKVSSRKVLPAEEPTKQDSFANFRESGSLPGAWAASDEQPAADPEPR